MRTVKGHDVGEAFFCFLLELESQFCGCTCDLERSQALLLEKSLKSPDGFFGFACVPIIQPWTSLLPLIFHFSVRDCQRHTLPIYLVNLYATHPLTLPLTDICPRSFRSILRSISPHLPPTFTLSNNLHIHQHDHLPPMLNGNVCVHPLHNYISTNMYPPPRPPHDYHQDQFDDGSHAVVLLTVHRVYLRERHASRFGQACLPKSVSANHAPAISPLQPPAAAVAGCCAAAAVSPPCRVSSKTSSLHDCISPWLVELWLGKLRKSTDLRALDTYIAQSAS